MSYETVTVMLVFSLLFIDLNMKGPNKHLNLKKKQSKIRLGKV